MSNYYDKRDAKVRIAEELSKMGWTIHGFSEDQSDSMTDYYCPAHWGGIATKNGYILVVDCDNNAESKPIEKYNPKGNLSFEDREKITKLEAMTVERGATAGEEENAKQLINKIKEKVSDQPKHEIVGYTLAHMGNPKGSIWHIEKDGKIYDKGNALTKFSDVPENHIFDINTMQFTDHYKKVWVYNDELGQRVYEDRQLTEKERKVINEFKALILRFERVVMGMNSCGDGTAETEKTGLEQQEKAGYELKTITKTKTGLKMVEITDRKYIKVGDYIKTSHHCCYWKVTEEYMRKGTWKGIQEEKKAFIYEQVGKESRGFQSLRNAQRYYDYEFRMIKDIEEGKTKIYELKEVTETIEIEKWVKIDKTKKTYNSKNSKTETKQEETTAEPETEQKQEQTTTEDYTITADTDTRDNSPLWVVKLNKTLSKEEYQKVSSQFKALKGYYSKFKHGFIFKYDPTDKLTVKAEQPEQTQQEEQPTESKPELSFIEIVDIILDRSTEIITSLDLTSEQYPTSAKYKKALTESIAKDNISITADIINYLKFNEYEMLSGILAEIKEEQENPYKQPEIEDGYIYDCHFKEWDIPMSEIQETITAMGITFIDWGEKIGFKGLTADQARAVKEISDINNSIYFIDAKTAIAEQPEESKQPDNIINMKDYKTQEEEPETMNNEENIFSKFDNIEINNNSRISADDEQFCKEQERLYSESFDMFIEFYNRTFEWYNNNIQPQYGKYVEDYQSHDNSFTSLRNAVYEINKSFVRNITGYFEKQYKITIDDNKIENALIKELSKDTSYYRSNQFVDALKKTDYNSIIDQIFIQLDGFSFQDKAIKEMKDKLKDKIGTWREIIVNKNKITIDRFIYPDYNWDNTKCNIKTYSDEPFIIITQALTHFETGKTNNIFNYLFNRLGNRQSPENILKTHEVNTNKIESFRFYKNGKFDIKFKSFEYARQFAKEYCGYIEKSA